MAHVALNGEALAGVIDGLVHRRPVPMYASDEQRDADIEELAGAEQADLRDRLLAATTLFADAVRALGRSAWAGTFTDSRRPTLARWPPSCRRGDASWRSTTSTSARRTPGTTGRRTSCVELLDAVTVDQRRRRAVPRRATDLGRDWAVGAAGGPTVTGTGADLGWWLTGRGEGSGLSSDAGALPRLGPWRRASATAVPTPER